MKIIEALRTKPNGKDLAKRVTGDIRNNALAKLEHVRDLFPHFTDHSMRHVEGVIQILDWLMPDELKEKLNEWELYFLLAATYLHDIGMVRSCPVDPTKEKGWEEFFDQYKAAHAGSKAGGTLDIELAAMREFVRANHHVRSEQCVRDKWKDLGLEASGTGNEGDFVGRLALGHRKVDLGDRTLFGEVPFGNNQLVRRDLLAAYLSLADDLDTTAFRTPWAEYEAVTHFDETSSLEYAKHLSISGVYSDHGVIVIGGTCRDHKVYLRLRRLQSDLKVRLADLKRMLRRPYATGDGFILQDPLPYHDVELRVEHVGYLPIEVKFELQDREIAKLIMGERLYGDRTACIRELLQNAVDTCREALEQRPREWEPKIEIAEEEDGKVLVVTDNGMGMDEHIVREYFARVGVSYYSSPDFRGKFKPISQFGIGILSCFMMADVIEVDTKRKGCTPIRLEIGSLVEPFVPRPGSRIVPGTRVSLRLKPDVVGTFDLTERVRYFARHVLFPIEVRPRSGSPLVVVDGAFVPTYDEVASDVTVFRFSPSPEIVQGERERFCVLMRQSWDRLADFHVNHVRNGMRFGVTLVGSFLDSIQKPEGFDGFVSSLRSRSVFCQNGFFVDNFKEQYEEFAGDSWAEFDLGGKHALDLTADRTRATGASKDTWREVVEAYSEAIELLFERSSEKERASKWWEHHIRHYCRGASTWLGPLPQALTLSAANHALWCTLSRDGLVTRGLPEVVKWSGPVYFLGGITTTRSGHGDWARLRQFLPADSLVVFSPQWSTGRGWDSALIERELKDGGALLADMAVTIQLVSLGDAKCRMVDAGIPLGKFNLCLGSGLGYSDYGRTPFLDRNHPLSGLLLHYCAAELETLCKTRLEQLFEAIDDWGDEPDLKLVVDTLRVLKAEGVLPVDTTFEFPEVEPIDHECPYARPEGS